MNKKGADLPGLMVWAIIYAVLFAFAFFYGVSFLKTSNAEFDTSEIEDSIVATRVINCFSNDNYFDESKMTLVDLTRCFDSDKYFLEIELKKKDGDNKLPLTNVPGEIHDYRNIKRYINLENENALLEINYVKNLRRYEDAA